MTRIELVIDEVVWHGGDASRRETFAAELQAAFERELAQPRVIRALGRTSSDIPSLDAGCVPRVAGDTVARAVAGGLVNATRAKP